MTTGAVVGTGSDRVARRACMQDEGDGGVFENTSFDTPSYKIHSLALVGCRSLVALTRPTSSLTNSKMDDDELPDDAPTAFTSLDALASDPASWDDSALVAAYDAAVGSYNRAPVSSSAKRQPPLPPTTSLPPTPPTSSPQPQPTSPPELFPLSSPSHLPPPPVPSRAPVPPRPHPPQSRTPLLIPSPQSRSPLLIPPPPPPPVADLDLEALLASWYECGYRAGVYAASRASRSPSN